MVIDEGADWVPGTCTLPAAERPLRVAEFDALFATARWSKRPQPTRLDLAIPPEAQSTTRLLVERESGCCSFFTFSFEQIRADVVMDRPPPP